MAINMQCDSGCLWLCTETGKKLEFMMKRLIVLRRCEPIVRFGCCSVRYAECRRNHAAHTGGYAVDGCREFMAEGEEGTSGALKCAACGCHRSFHRRVQDYYEVACECSSETASSD